MEYANGDIKIFDKNGKLKKIVKIEDAAKASDEAFKKGASHWKRSKKKKKVVSNDDSMDSVDEDLDLKKLL